jgi:hypothetical protein
MSDVAGYAMNNPYLEKQLYAAQLGAPCTPGVGHISLSWADGLISKSINRALSTEGALIVAEAVVKALEGEEERFAVEQVARQKAQITAQRDLMARMNAQSMQNIYRNPSDDTDPIQ